MELGLTLGGPTLSKSVSLLEDSVEHPMVAGLGPHHGNVIFSRAIDNRIDCHNLHLPLGSILFMGMT